MRPVTRPRRRSPWIPFLEDAGEILSAAVSYVAQRVRGSLLRATQTVHHGVMFGVVDFYKEAKKQGIKPIIGCEVYVAPRSRLDKEVRIDDNQYHLILLCKNELVLLHKTGEDK